MDNRDRTGYLGFKNLNLSRESTMDRMSLLKIKIEYRNLKDAFGVTQFKNHKRNEYTIIIDPRYRIREQTYTFWHEFYHIYSRLLERIVLKYGDRYKNKFSTDAGFLMNIGMMKEEENIAHRIAQCVEKELKKVKNKIHNGRNVK